MTVLRVKRATMSAFHKGRKPNLSFITLVSWYWRQSVKPMIIYLSVCPFACLSLLHSLPHCVSLQFTQVNVGKDGGLFKGLGMCWTPLDLPLLWGYILCAFEILFLPSAVTQVISPGARVCSVHGAGFISEFCSTGGGNCFMSKY